MFNKMNRQKAAVTNTTASNKGQELFGSCELLEELDDVELSAVVGGVGVKVGEIANVGANGEIQVHQNLIQLLSVAAYY